MPLAPATAPNAVEADQPVVYVFGDPRNAILSVFERRLSRTVQHGFTGETDAKAISDFVLRHAANLTVDAAPMDESWDLPRYLEHGFDLLRLEEHFDYWFYGDLPYSVLFVRYETLRRMPLP